MVDLFFDFPVYNSPTPMDEKFIQKRSNNKKFLIILRADDVNESNLDLLTKILTSIQIDIEKDILMVTIPDNRSYNLNPIIREHKIIRCISFGIPYSDLGLSVQNHEFIPFQLLNTTFLKSSKLQDLSTNRNSKTNLWKALKSHFM